jgi:hypothetical protein
MLEKQGVDVSFAEGLDTKSDPKRVKMGNFLELENSVFNKGGLLQKRNGYPKLSTLPNDTYSYVTTFNEDLTVIGSDIAAFNPANAGWVQKGNIQPCSVDTMTLIRNNLNQTQADSVVAPNGLVCTVYIEQNASSLTNKYVIADSVTGQNIVAPSPIPVASGTVSGGMKVFVLGNNFILVFTNTITATDHLQYVAISTTTPTNVSANTDLASVYAAATTVAWDAYVYNDVLFFAYNNTSGGQSMKVNYLTRTLVLGTAVTFAAEIATMVSVTADGTDVNNPAIYVSYYDAASDDGYTLAVTPNLFTLMPPEAIITNVIDVANITSVAKDGVCYIAYEVGNVYSFAPGTGTPTNYISAVTVTLATTTATAPYVVIRSLGLASKGFIHNGVIYFLGAYQSSYQSTYFLINASESTAASPVIVAKLAYSNGGGYLVKGLPNVTLIGDKAYIPYLFKSSVQAVNKDTDVPSGTQVVGIYSQTGINLSSFTINSEKLDSAEIGNNLNISGGFLWMYDGYLPVENNFFLWPDIAPTTPPSPINSAVAAWSATGGSIVAKPDTTTNTNAYFYQVTYEWTDNQGNAFKSAPSIPISVTTTGSGSAGSITLSIPTLRLTAKTANPVKIVIYRWSVAQQVYYQVTSITAPLLNVTTSDSVTFIDTLADASILGNNIIYTTGGVIENVAPPATDIVTLFDTRFWLVDSENRNSLWYSKQVLQSTPVEMSDLFTKYIPPTTATEGTTGPITALSAMDDKLIIFKENAILYINGSGPDNTGANNQYSEPIFITATVGCTNQRSIVLTPTGLMFQSNKGIWLLGRGLETSYIGAPVEEFTLGATVNSAVSVPATNQVRFTLDTGISLMFDYYYGQWGTFTGVPALSSCIYNDMHTFINRFASAYQERADYYLDGSNPVLMQFKTGPLRLGDLQGYQRAYFFYLLGNYVTPHKLQLLISYDYETSPSQSIIITPTNYSTPYGSGASQSPYGQGTPYGGGTRLENWRVFLERQRCMAFAIELREVYDRTYDVTAGAGLTLSGINVVMGFKKGFRPQEAAHSAG